MNKKISFKTIALYLTGLSIALVLVLLSILFDQGPSSSLNLFSRSNNSENKYELSHTYAENIDTFGKPSNCFFNQGQLTTFSTMLLAKFGSESQMIILSLYLVELEGGKITNINASLNVPECLYANGTCASILPNTLLPNTFSDSIYPSSASGFLYPVQASDAENLTHASTPIYPSEETYNQLDDIQKQRLKDSVVFIAKSDETILRKPAVIGTTADDARLKAKQSNSYPTETLQIYFQDNKLVYRRSYKDLEEGGQYLRIGQDPLFDRLIQEILKKTKDVSQLCYN